ncbi:MAG: hypothetical protein KME23_11010 [Goleter apudmare HA4340-LM2]|jgi:hypothetical protein|nr:hypothetical protein [Goleter apudmare HA4340-LM2]
MGGGFCEYERNYDGVPKRQILRSLIWLLDLGAIVYAIVLALKFTLE